MNDEFNINKKNTLTKANKAGKRDWDENIIPLCDTINEKPDYFTTSSCAGRMVLLKIPLSNSKKEAEWLFTAHKKFSHGKIITTLKYPPEEQVVYRYEPFILHVRCKDLNAAKKLLDLVRKIGLKRCGIVDLEQMTVEITGTAQISTLISSQKKLLLPEEYIKIMVDTSNMLLEGNWTVLEMLRKAIKNRL